LTGSILYLDSSALVKLIVPEAETIPLLRLMLAWPYRLAAVILGNEVGGFVTYDRNMRDAAHRMKLNVLAPS
jgi:predicted nucleic acid-binding protein